MGIKKNLHNQITSQPALDYNLNPGSPNLDPSYSPIEGIIEYNEEKQEKPGILGRLKSFLNNIEFSFGGWRTPPQAYSWLRSPLLGEDAEAGLTIKKHLSPRMNPVDFSQYIHTPQRPYPLVDQGTEDYFRQQFQNQIDLNELKANARKEVRAKALNIWNSRKQDDITKINLRPYQAFFDNLDRTNPTISYLHDRMQKDTLRKVYALDALHRMAKGDQRTEDDDKYFAENLHMLQTLDNYKQKAEEEHQRQVNQAVEMAKARHQEKLFNDFVMPMIKQQNASYGSGGSGPTAEATKNPNLNYFGLKKPLQQGHAEIKVSKQQESSQKESTIKSSKNNSNKQTLLEFKNGVTSFGKTYHSVITTGNADFSIITSEGKTTNVESIAKTVNAEDFVLVNGTTYNKAGITTGGILIEKGKMLNGNAGVPSYIEKMYFGVKKDGTVEINVNRPDMPYKKTITYTNSNIDHEQISITKLPPNNISDYKVAIGGLVPIYLDLNDTQYLNYLVTHNLEGANEYSTNGHGIAVVNNKDVIILDVESTKINDLKNALKEVVIKKYGETALKNTQAAAFDPGRAKGVYFKNRKDIYIQNKYAIMKLLDAKSTNFLKITPNN